LSGRGGISPTPESGRFPLKSSVVPSSREMMISERPVSVAPTVQGVWLEVRTWVVAAVVFVFLLLLLFTKFGCRACKQNALVSEELNEGRELK